MLMVQTYTCFVDSMVGFGAAAVQWVEMGGIFMPQEQMQSPSASVSLLLLALGVRTLVFER